MVRPKGLGMPARRKRKVPEPQEESKVMDNSEDEDRLYGSASPSSSSISSVPATRGPNKEKADAAYQEAAEGHLATGHELLQRRSGSPNRPWLIFS